MQKLFFTLLGMPLVSSALDAGACQVAAPHVGFDMPGNDLSQVSVVHDPTMTTAAACGALCCSTTLPQPCNAFTFCVAPSNFGACVAGQHCCFLKKSVGAFKKNPLADMASSTVSGHPQPPHPKGFLWQYMDGSGGPSSPAIKDGLVVAGGANHTVYALHSLTGKEAWKVMVGGPVQSSPAIVDGVVYIGGSDGVLRALRLENGASIWNFTTGGYLQSSPVVDAGVVYIGSGDEFIYAVDAAKGSLLWKLKTGAPVDSSPAVSAGLLYIGSYDFNLYALDAKTGQITWTINAGATIGSSPSVSGGTVFFSSSCHPRPCSGGWIYAVDAKTGAMRWNQSHLQSGNMAPPVVVADGTLFTSAQGGTQTFNASTGELLWKSPSSPGQALSVAAGHVLVSGGDYAKAMFSLSAADGKLEWVQDFPESVYSTPTADDSTVYVSTGNGLLRDGGSLSAIRYPVNNTIVV